MHYKNGREAKVGDTVLVKEYNGHFIGVVIAAAPGSTTCNLSVIPLPITHNRSATASECLHIEDALVPDAPK